MYREVILRELWSDLDDCVYRLMTDGVPSIFPDGDYVTDEKRFTEHNEGWRLYGYEQGRALGLALAIAKIDNLSEPDIQAVRRKAMERWETYLAEQE